MPDLSIEHNWYGKIIAGVDEVGRGCIAGPVFAAAVIISKDFIDQGIDDSKRLSAKKRESFAEYIQLTCQFAIGSASVEEINKINILEATKLASIRAVELLSVKPDIILVDGNMKFHDNKYISIIKGDSKSLSIAAASIVAKVARDKMMQELHHVYPIYDWQKNKGYGTKSHIEAIQKYGFNKHHRNFVIKRCVTT